MHADFWLQRWNAGQIGFHQAHVNQDLQQHWPSWGLSRGPGCWCRYAEKART